MEEKLKPINLSSQEVLTGQNETMMVDVQERASKHEVPREIQSWLKKIEQDPTQQTVVNDANGKPLLQLPATDPKIKLPVSRQKFANGFKLKVTEAGRWLSVFIFRLIKVKKGKVQFQEE